MHQFMLQRVLRICLYHIIDHTHLAPGALVAPENDFVESS